jgi:HSP20 family protein
MAKVPIKQQGKGAARTGLVPWEEFDRWFEDRFPLRLFEQWPWPRGLDLQARMPKVDVVDKDDEIIVKAELPGMSGKDLEISLTDNALTIRAERKEEKETKEGDYVVKEMHHGEFQRTLSLPDSVDTEKAKADFKDGVLELVLPKSAPAKRRTIKVE